MMNEKISYKGKFFSRMAGIVLVGILFLASACTHQIVMQMQPLAQDRKPKQNPVISVLRVEDGTTGPEYQQDLKFVGEDVSHWGLLAILPLRFDTNRYLVDRSRAEVVQDGMAGGLTKMGLLTVSRPETEMDQLHNLPDGHLVVKARIRSLEVTNSNFHVIVLIANASHIKTLHAQVSLDCQVVLPGESAPAWRGTVAGQAEWKLGEYGDADWTDKNVEWRDRAEVIRLAMENAVNNLVNQSNLRQLSASVQNDAHVRFMKRVQEREVSGDFQGALTLYAHAYRSAMSTDQADAAVAGIARVWQKLPSKPALPEEARRYGVQATSQADKKRYDEAIKLYEKSLDIAPWWAEGHFNRALVLADQNHYTEAIASMKRFVTLAPNSSDARAAQDKLYEWELEAQQNSGKLGTGQVPMGQNHVPAEALDAMGKGLGAMKASMEQMKTRQGK
ncbi:MAG: hypothetical protein ACT4OO_12415 [Nitrospiraceae bacterium]